MTIPGTHDGLALLYGRVNLDGTLISVWCRACGRRHTQGWARDARGPSHRVAHCTRLDSPYRDGGYYIAPEPSGEAAGVGR